MSIVLRNLKGSALTYTEMDRNQSQFFYSASINANTLHLHYTGSSTLNDGDVSYAPRFIEVPLGSGGGNQIIQAGTGIELENGTVPNSILINNTGTASPGDPNTSIQFNDGGSFGGDALFVYDKANDFVGIGITSGMTRRLHINDDSNGGAIIRLQSNTTANVNKQAYLEIGKGTSDLTQIGKLNGNSDNTYIHQTSAIQRTHFSFGGINSITATVNANGIGIGTQSITRDLSILSDSRKGIGISAGGERGVENRIRILPDDVWLNTFVNNSGDALGSLTKYGLGIHTPIPGSGDGGNMLIAVSDTEKGINELKNPNRLLIAAYDIENDDSLEGTPVHIASFTAAGRVGINTPDPNQDIRLDINGQYRGAYLATNSVDDVNFKNYSVIKVTLESVSAATPFFNIPPAGTKGVLVVTTDTNCTLNFAASPGVISTGNPEVVKDTYAAFTFVSEGTNLIETSRTVNMTT